MTKKTYKELTESVSFAFSDSNTINTEIFKELYFDSPKNSILQKSFMIIAGDSEIDSIDEGYHKKLPIDVITHFDLKSYNQKIRSCRVVKPKKYTSTILFSLNEEGDKLLSENIFD